MILELVILTRMIVLHKFVKLRGEADWFVVTGQGTGRPEL